MYEWLHEYIKGKNQWVFFNNILHSSEIRGLCSTKCPRETLQNLPYFRYMKIQSCFFHFSFHATLKIKWHEIKNLKNTMPDWDISIFQEMDSRLLRTCCDGFLVLHDAPYS